MRLAFDPDLLRACWFLAGPTASGKTAASIELAERLGAEIVSLDSMSLYRGMDIGTAKPEPALRERVPHHLLDIIEPGEDYSLAQYVAAAESACGDIVSRGKTPLFVGGTGLYLRTVLRGMFQGPPADWELRRRWADQAEERGEQWLHDRLRDVDAPSAERLHVQDVRRVIRALEVHELTGRPLSQWQTDRPRPVGERTRHVYWLSPERGWLHERIALRVRAMLDGGWLEEVRSLAAGPPLGRTARQAVGYRELLEHLEGRCTFDEAARLIAERTRQFAKRQFTWFRNLEECLPVPITANETASEIAARVAQAG